MKSSNKNEFFNLTNILFIIYCMLLVWIILLKLSFSIDDIMTLDRFRRINLIPFYYPNEVKSHFSEVIENLLIFIPFGIYLKMLNKGNKKTILYGFLFSLVLEISQFIFKIGATDITDLITNTFGTVIGVCGYVLLEKIFKNKEKLNNVLKILALVVTILFCIMMLLLIIAN